MPTNTLYNDSNRHTIQVLKCSRIRLTEVEKNGISVIGLFHQRRKRALSHFPKMQMTQTCNRTRLLSFEPLERAKALL